MTSPNYKVWGNINVTESVPSQSSICLMYYSTSLPHRHHQVVSFHLYVFPQLLEGCMQVVIVHQKWILAKNCLIKNVPDVLYWGIKSGEYADQSSTQTFTLSRNFLLTWVMQGLALWCWRMVLFRETKGKTIECSVSSQFLSAFKLPIMVCSCVQCPWDIPDQTSMPLPLCAILCLTVRRNTHCHPPALWSWKCDSSWKRIFLHCASVQDLCLLTHANSCRCQAGMRSNPSQGQRARILVSPFRQFREICRLNKPTV